MKQRKHKKGLSLDPQRNQNQNQNQNQILISRHVEEEDQNQNPSVKESSFHGFHHQHQNHKYIQQVQQLHPQHQHQLLFGFGVEGGLDTQSSPKKRSYLPSSSSQTNEYATALPPKMGDSDTTHHCQTCLGNLGNTGGGEIVQIQGGHIVRPTGRKDRHSKVCTAKGPKDRRVRLSAHTAIQFYDVQDRLGYDRPSKAVDWLIKKAKAAIDELDKLPAWKPTIGSISINPTNSEDQNQHQLQQQLLHWIAASSNSNALRLNEQQQPNENNNSSFLPPSMNSDSIADTIKSFFPMGASTETNSSASAANNIQFHHNFPPDLPSRSSQSQYLRLSLQSFRDPMLLYHNHHQNQHHHHNEQSGTIFSRTPFDVSGRSENSPGEMGQFQRMVSWNAVGDNGPSGGGAFVFNSPSPLAQPMPQPLFGQNQQLLFSQRGPLQSSNTPSVRAWIDPSAFSAANDHLHQASSLPFHPTSLSGIGFASGGGFSGFRIPVRIQGEEEEYDGISDKPLPTSSDSRH